MNKKIVKEKVDCLSIWDFDYNTIDEIVAKLQDIQAKHSGVLKIDTYYSARHCEQIFRVVREREETDEEYHQRISAEDLRKNQEMKKMLDWVEQNQDTVKWKLEQLTGSAK